MNYRISTITSTQTIEQLYCKINPNTREKAVENMSGSIWRFVKEIKRGDLVFLPFLSQGSKPIAEGEVEGDYKYEERSPEVKHIRPVKWPEKNILISEFDEDTIKQFQRPMTVYEIRRNNAVEKIGKVLEKYGVIGFSINESILVEKDSFLPVFDEKTYPAHS